MPHGIGNPFLVYHEVQLAIRSHLVPVAREVKGRPGNGLKTQQRPIKLLTLLQIFYYDPDVVVLLYLDHCRSPFSSDIHLDTPAKQNKNLLFGGGSIRKTALYVNEMLVT
jgi:hypothetical protein